MALSSYRRGCSGLSTLIVFSLLLFVILHLSVRTVNAQLVTPNEALSSPSHINALKKSDVWLHWNYNFVANSAVTFKRQECSMNDTVANTVTLIAQKIGENGPLQAESVLPSSLVNRVTAFANNNTLMIKDLEYNDTARQFLSKAYVKLTGFSESAISLQPTISITVTGVPAFLSAPASAMEVAEGGNLVIVPRFDGNPKPSAQFQWSHKTSITTIYSTQEYPYMYRATYSFDPISASDCGRVVNTRLFNNVGTSADKSTNVTVLLNLDASPNLRAGKPNQSCVEVNWQKKESGLCQVTYTVKLKNVSGVILYQESGINIAKIVKCGIPSNVNITGVELTMTSTKRENASSAVVQQSPLPPPTTLAPTTKKKSSTRTSLLESSTITAQSTASAFPGSVKPTGPGKPTTSGSNTGAIVGGAVGGLIGLVIIIFVCCWCIKRSKKSGHDTDSGEPGYPLANKKENVYSSAEEAEPRRVNEPMYADPNKPSLIYGKLGEGGGRKGPRPLKKEADTSDYADVKVDEHGYPAVGAVPTSYTDGYRSKAPSTGSSRGDSGRRAAPPPGPRREPPPYNDPKLDGDGYPASKNIPPVYAQVNKPRKHR